jgi:hypothetical protein
VINERSRTRGIADLLLFLSSNLIRNIDGAMAVSIVVKPVRGILRVPL